MREFFGGMYSKCFTDAKLSHKNQITVMDKGDVKFPVLRQPMQNQENSPKARAYQKYVDFNTEAEKHIKSIVKDEVNTRGAINRQSQSDGKFKKYFLQHMIPKTKLTPITASKSDTWLTVCKKNLLYVRPSIALLSNLKTLQICCNDLKTLPKEICELRSLYKLILARNKLNELPNNIGALRNLRELNVSKNRLKFLPRSIASLRKLVILNVNGNRLLELQPTIGGCSSLKYILISHNTGIKFLPASLLRIPFLQSIEHNGIMFEDANFFKCYKYQILGLEELSLRVILNNNLDILKNSSKYFIDRIKCVKECFYCKGAYFSEYYVSSFEKHIGGSLITFRGYTCTTHFKNEQEYRNNLFLLSHNVRRQEKLNYYPRLSEIFILSCYPIEKLKEILRYKINQQSNDRIPLFALCDNFNNLSYSYVVYAAEHEHIILKDDYQAYNDI